MKSLLVETMTAGSRNKEARLRARLDRHWQASRLRYAQSDHPWFMQYTCKPQAIDKCRLVVLQATARYTLRLKHTPHCFRELNAGPMRRNSVRTYMWCISCDRSVPQHTKVCILTLSVSLDQLGLVIRAIPMRHTSAPGLRQEDPRVASNARQPEIYNLFFLVHHRYPYS